MINISSNNFKEFNGIRNDYIKGELNLSIKVDDDIEFINLIFPCTTYDYFENHKAIFVTTLLDNNSLEISRGWSNSYFIYDPITKNSNVVLSRYAKTHDFLEIKINLITFGQIENILLEYELLNSSYQVLNTHSYYVSKILYDKEVSVKLNKYTVSQNDEISAFVSTTTNGVKSTREMKIKVNAKTSEYQFKINEKPFKVAVMKPILNSFKVDYEKKTIYVDCLYADKIQFFNGTSWIDIQSEYTYKTDLEYYHIKIFGYNLRIERVIYVLKDNYAHKLEQTLFHYLDTDIKLMRIDSFVDDYYFNLFGVTRYTVFDIQNRKTTEFITNFQMDEYFYFAYSFRDTKTQRFIL